MQGSGLSLPFSPAVIILPLFAVLAPFFHTAHRSASTDPFPFPAPRTPHFLLPLPMLHATPYRRRHHTECRNRAWCASLGLFPQGASDTAGAVLLSEVATRRVPSTRALAGSAPWQVGATARAELLIENADGSHKADRTGHTCLSPTYTLLPWKEAADQHTRIRLKGGRYSSLWWTIPSEEVTAAGVPCPHPTPPPSTPVLCGTQPNRACAALCPEGPLVGVRWCRSRRQPDILHGCPPGTVGEQITRPPVRGCGIASEVRFRQDRAHTALLAPHSVPSDNSREPRQHSCHPAAQRREVVHGLAFVKGGFCNDMMHNTHTSARVLPPVTAPSVRPEIIMSNSTGLSRYATGTTTRPITVATRHSNVWTQARRDVHDDTTHTAEPQTAPRYLHAGHEGCLSFAPS